MILIFLTSHFHLCLAKIDNFLKKMTYQPRNLHTYVARGKEIRDVQVGGLCQENLRCVSISITDLTYHTHSHTQILCLSNHSCSIYSNSVASQVCISISARGYVFHQGAKASIHEMAKICQRMCVIFVNYRF